MSAAFRPALPVIAFQLAAAIEHYQIAFEALVAGDRTARAWTLASALLNEVRMLGGAFPAMAGDTVELLIGHAEWAQSIAGGIRAEANAGEVALRQGQAAGRIHQKCVALFCRD